MENGIRKMANWNTPGLDSVRGFWFERFKPLFGLISVGLQHCLDNGEVPEWMVKGRLVLIEKDDAKGTVASYYRLITTIDVEEAVGYKGLVADRQGSVKVRSGDEKVFGNGVDQLLEGL